MSIEYNTRFFPNFKISKQLFYVPGISLDGGFTTGGARISAPDIGGFSGLQIQPSMSIGEWNFPSASWLMSKTNGQIFRIRLAPTPQVARIPYFGQPVPWDTGLLWSNDQMWQGDVSAQYLTDALEGSNVLEIDMSLYGQVLQIGHVIGHKFDCYMIDDISYDNSNNVATLIVMPPLRRAVVAGDDVLFRPWFTGSIDSTNDFKTTYDSNMVGMIQLNMITLNEVIL